MAKTKMQCTATVQLTIELPHCGGAWGEDCPISQVHKQAKDAAIGKVRKLCEIGEARIIGEPTVKMIMSEKTI